ncbi:T9SS type A sorting domain-containing protein [Flavobacterium sp.]|uniref:T9SS type A sorting domain-containing protein n=1 Tax=Flavobacterium sp. TaxID=239 RepID=UPI0038D4B76B
MSNFKVYPIPANNTLFINSEKEEITSIQLLDSIGKILNSIEVNTNAYSFEILNYTKGIYYLKIETKTGKKNIKIIKN